MMPTWRVLSRTNGTSPGVDLRLPSQAAARAQALVEKARPEVLTVSVHACPHAAGEKPATWFDCHEDSRAEYEEV